MCFYNDPHFRGKDLKGLCDDAAHLADMRAARGEREEGEEEEGLVAGWDSVSAG